MLVALLLIILTLLYIIRKYEKSSQKLKYESDFQQSRMEYLELLDSLQDAYVETDPRGNITHSNLAFLNELGYKGKEEVIGQPFWYFIQKKFAGDVANKFKILIDSGQALERFETRFRGKDGKQFIGEALFSPVFQGTEFLGTKATIRNNTRRFDAEKDLAVQKDFLDELLQQNPLAVVLRGTNQKISFVNPAFEKLFAYTREEALGKNLEDLVMSPELKEEKGECAELYPEKIISLNGRRRTKAGDLIDLEIYAQRFFVGSQNYGKLIFYHDISIRVKAEEILRMARDVAERDLEIGREMQSGFFPQLLPEIPGWEVHAYFKSARQVSGDFYDVFPIGNGDYTGFVMADVCDKGVGAAFFMVLLRSLIRSFSEQDQEKPPADQLVHKIALKVNSYIVNNHGQSNMFATLVFGILDPKTHRFFYVNGGHDAPVLIDTTGKIRQELEPGGPAFGFSTDLDFDVGQVDFLPGELLLAFTDGLTEAKNMTGDFYSEERLYREISRRWPSVYSAVKHLELDVGMHMGERDQYDDISLLGIRRKQHDEITWHRFTQKAELSCLPLFRGFVGDACQYLKLDEEIRETLTLAADELCSNLILHGYREMEAGEISLAITRKEEGVEVLVEDSGQAFDPENIKAPYLGDDMDKREIGGLGIYMVKEMVDEMKYESKGGRNFLTLKLNIAKN